MFETLSAKSIRATGALAFVIALAIPVTFAHAGEGGGGAGGASMYMNPAGSELPLKPFQEMRRMIMENGEKNVIDFEPFNKTDRQLKVFRTYR